MDIDQVRLNLNESSIGLLKIIIALIMYGVALDLKISDFKSLLKKPKALIAGFTSQIILFPLLIYLLINFVDMRPSIAFGLVMVAACPTGNLANIMTSMGRGNVALSVGLTASLTILALFLTPFLLVFLGEKIPGASMVLGKIHLDQGKILEGVFIILGLPMCLGMLTTKFFPVFSSKLHKVMGKISFLFLLMFIAGALAANYQHFISHIEIILKISFLTNILVLLTGFLCAKAFALNGQDTRAVVFVMGIRNVALGLALVFQFFEGMGGMAIIVAWWGVSQISMELILISILKYIDTRKRVIA